MAIIFFVSPLLGGMTDRAPRRMPFLVFSTVVCVGLTAILGTVGYRASLVAFVFATPRTRRACSSTTRCCRT